MIIKYLLWKVLGLLAKASLKLLDAGGFLSLNELGKKLLDKGLVRLERIALDVLLELSRGSSVVELVAEHRLNLTQHHVAFISENKNKTKKNETKN